MIPLTIHVLSDEGYTFADFKINTDDTPIIKEADIFPGLFAAKKSLEDTPNDTNRIRYLNYLESYVKLSGKYGEALEQYRAREGEDLTIQFVILFFIIEGKEHFGPILLPNFKIHEKAYNRLTEKQVHILAENVKQELFPI